MIAQQHSLGEILRQETEPPYSLADLANFLSRKNCLENLDFLLAVDRYKKHYDGAIRDHTCDTTQFDPVQAAQELVDLWNEIIALYIQHASPFELNLPSELRDDLLRIPSTFTPPQPACLGPAYCYILDLVEYSLLQPFLTSVLNPEPQDMFRGMGMSETKAHRKRNTYSRLPIQSRSKLDSFIRRRRYTLSEEPGFGESPPLDSPPPVPRRKLFPQRTLSWARSFPSSPIDTSFRSKRNSDPPDSLNIVDLISDTELDLAVDSDMSSPPADSDIGTSSTSSSWPSKIRRHFKTASSSHRLT